MSIKKCLKPHPVLVDNFDQPILVRDRKAEKELIAAFIAKPSPKRERARKQRRAEQRALWRGRRPRKLFTGPPTPSRPPNFVIYGGFDE